MSGPKRCQQTLGRSVLVRTTAKRASGQCGFVRIENNHGKKKGKAKRGIKRITAEKGRFKAARTRLDQSGRICERNAVVETRSVSVTSRRLRCRLATTGCYRPSRSSQLAGYTPQFSQNYYACLLPPPHIISSYFIVSRFFAIILPSEACLFLLRLFRSFGPLTLLQSPRFYFHL